ncbi:cell division protein DivIVA [Salipaludibacillus keqinensis]|uniref:Cell division protein DivIVA n=1 Tax=Salipaludibacillus keqinensis TaxID=2045207 RepID=A0A323TNC9_9BACI|nr:DUF2203 domain-containing protein [Salipaludibacillus keqinensis]PYZ95197.1 cell division protein DivIVA [Salipaludibacillus keqinensis]
MAKKYFTLEEANHLIPLMEQELIKLRELQGDFDDKLSHLNKLKTANESVQTDTGSLFKMESELEFLEMQAQLHVNNIQNTGAQLKGIDPGLIDFLSVKEDEEILLCWKEGEKEITHYHGESEGFAGRKPL